MKLKTLVLVGVAMLSMGCGVSIYNPEPGCAGDEVIIVDHPYVNTYLPIPDAIRTLIAPCASGYSSPRLSRYDEYLYPHDAAYDPDDLPCYVRSDFNGDGYYDYAFLFSRDEWEYGEWYLTTKMIVVLSTRDGWEIGADVILGTVSADASVPVEEYWSILLVPAGQHTFTSYKNGATITKTITLDNDAFYLASLDPAEESIFYAEGNSVYEMSIDGGLAKKQALGKRAEGQTRYLEFNKQTEGRQRPVK